MSSEYFIVKSQRDNKIAMARFYQGTLEEYTEDDYKTDKITAVTAPAPSTTNLSPYGWSAL